VLFRAVITTDVRDVASDDRGPAVATSVNLSCWWFAVGAEAGRTKGWSVDPEAAAPLVMPDEIWTQEVRVLRLDAVQVRRCSCWFDVFSRSWLQTSLPLVVSRSSTYQ
jgi:hypothetical protein